MPDSGKVWTVRDRHGNQIYLTQERWNHILEFHPEMEPFFGAIRQTVQKSRRRQAAENPHKWFYVSWGWDGLELWNNCIVVVVAYRPPTDRFVVTSYQDWISER